MITPPNSALPAIVPDFRLRAETESMRGHNLPTAGDVWPEWVENALFVCWLKANQSMPAALRLLRDEWDAYASFADPATGEIRTHPYQEVPFQTAHAWKRRHDWERKATQVIAETFPELTRQVAALTLRAQLVAMRTLIDVMQGEHPKARPADLIEAAKTTLMTGGTGTWGSVMRQAPVVREAIDAAIDLTGMTEQELAAWQIGINQQDKTRQPDRTR
jgi:hypothetical protein